MTWKLEFSDQQMEVLNEALVSLPYRTAAPVIQDINKQIAAQREAAEGADSLSPLHPPQP